MYLQNCTGEFYAAQSWDLQRELDTEEWSKLDAFQQQVFQMINQSLRNVPHMTHD